MSIVIEMVIQLQNVEPLNFSTTIVTGKATLRIGVKLKMGDGYPMKRELKAAGIINPRNNIKGRKGTPIHMGPFLPPTL